MRDVTILYDLESIIDTSKNFEDATYGLINYFAEFLRRIKCEESADRILRFIGEEYDNDE